MTVAVLTFSGDLNTEAKSLMQDFMNATAEFHNKEIAELVATGMTEECAMDVTYLRTRSRHTAELEARLIREHKEGKRILISDWPDHSDKGYDPFEGQG